MARALRSAGIAFILLLSSILMAGVIAQETDRPREPNVHGMVTDSVTEDPVHALVYVVGREKDIMHKVESGRDGTFSLLLPSGAYIWEAEAEGYKAGRGEFKVGDSPIRLLIVMDPLEKDPEEPPEFNVGGMLLDAKTGEGVHGLVAFWNNDGKGTQIETDESGHFKLLVPPGVWLWKATARGYEIREGRLLMEKDPIRLTI
ncbi:MAG: hypothetical protein ACMUHY_04815, partial [Thermoplasmatota archaeon]